jgi:hypothetical protein
MFIKCSYEVRLSDFGIKHKDVPDKVSDVIKLEQVLRLSTEAQDDGAPPEPGGMERAAGGP